MSKVLFVANRVFALTNSRRKLIDRLVANGHEVVICSARDSHSNAEDIKGVSFYNMPFYRGGASFLKEIYCFFILLCVFFKFKPDLVHSFNAKPVIYSGFIMRLFFRGATSISVITGLGHAFLHGSLLKKISGYGYKIALKRKGNHTVFQNGDDFSLFVDSGWVDRSNASLIVGSGVDVRRFYYHFDAGRTDKKVLMIGRLINQKGVREFVESAKLVKKDFNGSVEFVLIGEQDDVHPDAVDFSFIKEAVAQKTINYLGFEKDVVPHIHGTDVFVLPSYREGVPRTVLEAASCGVPCVGANVPGTRECIRSDETGFLVEVQNVKELSGRILQLLNDTELREKMSLASRHFMEERFDIQSITDSYLKLYLKVGGIDVSN